MTDSFSIPWLPEYIKVRNQYNAIPSWLHWLFPRLCQRYEELKLEQRQVILDTVIGAVQPEKESKILYALCSERPPDWDGVCGKCLGELEASDE